MKFFGAEKFILVSIIMLAVISGASFYLQDVKILLFGQTSIIPSVNLAVADALVKSYTPPQKLSNPPDIIKAVYVTGYSAGSRKYLSYLSNLFKTTEINAVVVDIKDYSGLVSYKSEASGAKKYNLYNNAIPDIDALVKFFHDQNVYLIGRIAVFEDPEFSKSRPELAVYDKTETTDLLKPVLWQDNNKLSWLDPSSKEVWDYNISLAKDALYHGFDEINFDYIRFPSDGKTENMGFPVWNGKMLKSEIIREFFQYLRVNLQGEKISADLFGQTTINKDDMGIGQIIESAFENFDYIAPMIYPSHYINGFMDFANPAEHPYEIVKYSLDSALVREKFYADFLVAASSASCALLEQVGSPCSKSMDTENDSLAKFRPWLQDFNMGADYTAEMVKQEIKATQDALGSDYAGYMLWNPSNIYTEDAIVKLN